MKRFLTRWLLWGLLGLLVHPVPVLASRGVALVIGNAAYQAEARLVNPVRDAKRMAKLLEDRADFEVILVTDANKQRLEEAVTNFLRRLSASSGVGWFFYSGHGQQVDGVNYMVPVDAVIQDRFDVEGKTVALNRVLNGMSGRGGDRVNVVVLDACRNNPFRRGDGKAIGDKGLARVEAPDSTLILYAAKPGQTASDNPGEDNGLFTKYFLSELEQPGRTLQDIFLKVVQDVYTESKKRQHPWPEGALMGPFVLIPGNEPGPGPDRPNPLPVVDVEENFWQSTLKCGMPSCFKAYRSKYPRGRYVELAEAQLEVPTPVPVVVPPPKPDPVVPLPDPLPPEPGMVRIRKGCFEMGSPAGEEGRDDDERRHRVCIKQDFELGKMEVTVGEFRRFVEEKGYKTDAERNAGGNKGCYAKDGESSWSYQSGRNWKQPGYQQADDHPVVCVSWNDAVAYAKWLKEKTGNNYHLPTEAEWEYAARAGTETARYWGNDPNQACQYANVADQSAKQVYSGWTIHDCRDGYVHTAPVGSFTANAWRLHDMLGNVWEWTCSAWADSYDGSEQRCQTSGDADRVYRGGSWHVVPRFVRAAFRFLYSPGDRGSNLGFRLARTL